MCVCVCVCVFVLVLVLASFVASCTPDVFDVDRLEPPEEARSMIFALETSGHLAVEAYALTEASTAIERSFVRRSSAQAEMTALFYRADLDQLGLDPGTVPASTRESSSRPLPTFEAAVVNRLGPSGQTGWTQIASLEGSLAAFRTPDVDFSARCASREGCYADASESPACLTPCPESEIAPVLAPAPLVVECPRGWQLEHRGRFCDPYPEGVLECEEGKFQLPGDRSCQPIGRVCPEPGTWPPDLPESSIERPLLFVNQSAPGSEQDADGSTDRPFHTIGRALEAAATRPNALVVISEGTYAESLVLKGHVSLRGSCVSRTVLQPDGGDSDDAGTVIAVQGTSALEDLTLEGGAHGLVVGAAEAQVEARGLRARNTSSASLLIEAGSVFVEDTQLSGRTRGIQLTGGSLEAQRIQIFGAGTAGITATGGRIVLDVAQIETNQVGLAVSGTAEATLARARFLGNHEIGVHPHGDARLEVSSSMFGGVRDASASATDNDGIHAEDRAHVALKNSWFVNAQNTFAALAFNHDTRATLEDIAVVGCPSSNVDAVALHVWSAFNAKRLHVEACPVAMLINSTATASIADAHFLVSDRGFETEGSVFGARWQIDGGVINATGGVVNVTDLEISGATVQSGPCMATAGDFSLSANRVRLNLEDRDGLVAKGQSRVSLKNASVVGHAAGLRATDDALIDLENFDVRASLAALHVTQVFSFITETWGASRITARHGLVRDSKIGALVPARASVVDVFDHVRYVSNEQNFVYIDEASAPK